MTFKRTSLAFTRHLGVRTQDTANYKVTNENEHLTGCVCTVTNNNKYSSLLVSMRGTMSVTMLVIVLASTMLVFVFTLTVLVSVTGLVLVFLTRSVLVLAAWNVLCLRM